MANYNKSFNLRNGVQVDEDDLIVRGSLVGIGTTLPASALHVIGDARFSGVVTSPNLYVTGIATLAKVQIGSGITIDGNAGVITATFVGNGAGLFNIPTSQWVDVNPAILPIGIAYSSIYAAGTVGIATTVPNYYLQVGGNANANQQGVGIDSTGNIILTGVVTSLTGFVGSGAGVTSINATNITSGTLDNARIPSSINLTGVVSATGLRATGIATIGFATITSAYIGVVTVGFISATTFQTSGLSIGVATITTADIATANIGFASITNTVVGTGTFTSATITTGIITNLSNTFQQVSGTSTITTLRATNGYIGLGTFDSWTGTGLRVTGIGTIATLVGTSASVGFVTSNVSYLGVATASNIRAGNVRIGFSNENTIESTSGSVFIGNATDQVTFNNNVYVTGVSTFQDLVTISEGIAPDTNAGAYIGQSGNAFSEAFIDNIAIGNGIGKDNTIDTVTGDLVLDAETSSVKVSNNFYVTGISTLSGQTVLDTGIIPDTNAGAYIGQSGNVFGAAFIDNVTIGNGIGKDNTIDTVTGDLVLDASTTLVNVAQKFSVTGISTLSGEVTVDTGIIPDANGAYLGSSTRKFTAAFIDNVTIGNGAGADNTIGSLTGGITLDSNSGYVTINDQLRVTGLTTFNQQVQLATGIIPTTANTAYVGSSASPFAEIYAGNIRLGVTGDNTIDTSSGNLILSSATNTIEFNGDFTITGITSFSGETVFATGIVPDANGAYIGQSAKPWSEAYIGNLTFANNNANTIESLSGGIILDSNSGYVTIDDSLRVSGISTFDSSVTLDVGIVPGPVGAYLGQSGTPFNSLYVGQITAGIIDDYTVSTQTGNLTLKGGSGTVQVDDTLDVTGTTLLQGEVITNTGIVPDSNLDAYLGASGNAFGPAYLSNITVGVGSTGRVSTTTQDLELTSATNLVKVTSRLMATGQSYLIGITTIKTGLLPDVDGTGYVGNIGQTFEKAYFGAVSIGAGSSNNINSLSGNLVLTSDSNIVEVQDKLTAQSVDITSQFIANNNIIIDGNNANVKIGIGTTDPSSSLEIKVNSGDALSQVIARNGAAIISLGQTTYNSGAGTSVGFISYSGSTLQISNNDVGNINSVLHAGPAGVSTGDFAWTYGQSNARLMTLTYEGNLGLGIQDPTSRLHVVGVSTVTGDSYVSGSLSVGSTIFGTLNFPDNLIQNNNVLTTTGISTFWKIGITSTFYSNPEARIGINTDPLSLPKSSINGDVIFGVEGKSLFSNVGIGTTVGLVTTTDVPSLHVVGPAIFDGVYIGTDRNFVGDPRNIHIFDANITIHGDTNGCLLSLNGANVNFDSNSSLRFGTGSGGIVDFGNAGAVGLGTTVRYMVPPKLTTDERSGLASTVAGAFIFNTTTNTFQGYTGVAWTDFH